MNTVLTPAFTPSRPAVAPLLRWQEPLATSLRFRFDLPGQVANRMLNVELGLYLLMHLLPLAPAEALPDLLNGQGVAYRERPVWTPRQHRMLSRARALLSPYQNRTVWFNALTRYAALPTRMRVFSTDSRGGWNAEAGSFAMRERAKLFEKALG